MCVCVRTRGLLYFPPVINMLVSLSLVVCVRVCWLCIDIQLPRTHKDQLGWRRWTLGAYLSRGEWGGGFSTLKEFLLVIVIAVIIFAALSVSLRPLCSFLSFKSFFVAFFSFPLLDQSSKGMLQQQGRVQKDRRKLLYPFPHWSSNSVRWKKYLDFSSPVSGGKKQNEKNLNSIENSGKKYF